MAAAAVLHQLICELELDIIFIQEPYDTRSGHIADLPSGYSTFHRLGQDHQYGAAIIYRSPIQCRPLSGHSSNEIVGIEVNCSPRPISCYSMYCRPTQDNIWDFICPLLQKEDFRGRDCIICVDSNAHSPLWNSNYSEGKGREVEDVWSQFRLHVCNVAKEQLNFVPQRTTFVDITIVGDDTSRLVKNWRYLSHSSLSDHFYIYFTIALSAKPKKNMRPSLPTLINIDSDLCKQLISERQKTPLAINSTAQIDDEVTHLTNVIQSSIYDSAARPPSKLKKRAPWWSQKLYEIRQQLRSTIKNLTVNPE